MARNQVWAHGGQHTEAEMDRFHCDPVVSVGHGFSTGDPLRPDSGGDHAVATNTAAGGWARSIAIVDDVDNYAAFYGAPMPIYLPAHGLGARGTQLYLGDGAIVAEDVNGDPPAGSGVELEQRLGEVAAPYGESDTDWIMWDPWQPTIYGGGA